jgi:hypothetical protein
MTKRISRIIILAALIALFELPMISSTYAESALPHSESKARAIDEKAYQVKRTALTYFTAFVRKNRGRPKEPAYLLRLAEMAQDTAAIEFRIAYGKQKPGHPVNLTEYKNLMKRSIAPLNALITRFPRSRDIPRAYRLRAKALAETSQVDQAVADLKYLVDTWPRSADAPIANVDLWTFLIQKKDYATAIRYIQHYGAKPTDRHYNSALEKLSMCYYFLDNIDEAIRYAEAELRTAKTVERSKAISNLALFYATGIEKKRPGLDAGSAIARFQRSVAGEDLGNLLVSFAYLLRAKGLDAQIELLKASLGSAPLSDAMKSDLHLICLENELNRRDFAQIKASVQTEAALYNKSALLRKDKHRSDKIHQTFADALPILQKQTTPDPNVSEGLRTIYEFMLATTQGDSFQQAKIHYNMAESLLVSKDVEKAVAHYRWVVDHTSFDKPAQKDLFVNASLKALTGRLETLKTHQWVPKEIVAHSLKTSPREVPPPVLEWISWIDHFPVKLYTEKKIDELAFAANRILYSFDHVEDATDRLKDFIKAYPTSPSAIPSASLIIDTYIASQDWRTTYELTSKYLQVPQFKTPEFQARLADLAADSYCKILDESYRAKNYTGTLKGADDYLAHFPTTKRRSDFLELAANSALGLGDKARAAVYFKSLEQLGTQKTEVLNLASMTDGSLAEDHFDFRTASSDYRKYLENGGTSSPELRTKILLFAWLSGDSAALSSALKSRAVCPTSTDAVCASYANRSNRAPFLERLEQANKNVRLSASSRMSIVKAIPEAWAKEDSLLKYTLLSRLQKAVPDALHLVRMQVRKENRIKLDPNVIKKRVKSVEQAQTSMENAATIPLIHIRLLALLETGGLYDDLVNDLQSAPEPKGLSAQDRSEFKKTLAEIASPFAQKRDELHKTAVDLANRSGIDESAFIALAKSLQSDARLKDALVSYPRGIQQEAFGSSLEALLKPGDSESSKSLVSSYRQALSAKNWIKAGFLIQWAQTKLTESKGELKLPSETLSVMKSLLLARTDAISEASLELRQSLSEFSGTEHKVALLALMSSSYPLTPQRDLADWTGELAEEDPKFPLSPKSRQLLATATKWANFDNRAPTSASSAKSAPGASGGTP